MATCKECKLFSLEAAKDEAGLVQPDWLVKCKWEPKEGFPLPLVKRLKRAMLLTTAKDGNGCPCFQKRGTK